MLVICPVCLLSWHYKGSSWTDLGYVMMREGTSKGTMTLLCLRWTTLTQNWLWTDSSWDLNWANNFLLSPKGTKVCLSTSIFKTPRRVPQYLHFFQLHESILTSPKGTIGYRSNPANEFAYSSNLSIWGYWISPKGTEVIDISVSDKSCFVFPEGYQNAIDK